MVSVSTGRTTQPHCAHSSCARPGMTTAPPHSSHRPYRPSAYCVSLMTALAAATASARMRSCSSRRPRSSSSVGSGGGVLDGAAAARAARWAGVDGHGAARGERGAQGGAGEGAARRRAVRGGGEVTGLQIARRCRDGAAVAGVATKARVGAINCMVEAEVCGGVQLNVDLSEESTGRIVGVDV